MQISYSEFRKFLNEYDPSGKDAHLRFGQAAHNYFKLERITNPEDLAFCDKLWCEKDNSITLKMLESIIDYGQ